MKDLIDKYVGKPAKIQTEDGLWIEVEIKDVKTSYGKERFLVTPVSGSGEVWKEQVILIK